ADLANLSCTYAALILHDEGIEISADKIKTLLKAADIKIDTFWANMYAKVLAKRNVSDLLVPTSGGSAPAAAPAATGSAPAEKKEEKEEVKEEEEDVDMGGMFGDDDDF
ncbi:UNVERIFIED_CONTAM: hypothetical protein GTU68_031474, partial [Idotea baltica]|nr:hypothetical protein [Idotea baltica]